MFFDQVPPDTSVYMIAGYSVFFVITAIYLVSLFIRARNLRRDLDTLEGLRAEAQAPTAAPAPVRKPPLRKNDVRKPSSRTKAANFKQPRKKTARKR